MNIDPDVLDRIDEPLRGAVRRFAEKMLELTGPGAVSLTLHGPIAAGAFDPSSHRVLSSLLLRSLDFDLLRRVARECPAFARDRIAEPNVAEAGAVEGSLDTFPLEFLEIQQCHMTLFGEDVFAAMRFQEEHVRLQCERELKLVVIGLRQGLLASGGDDARLGEIGSGAAERLTRTLRGLLWLQGQRQARPVLQIVDAMESYAGRPLQGLRAALDPWGARGWEPFRALYEDVELLKGIADAW